MGAVVALLKELGCMRTNGCYKYLAPDGANPLARCRVLCGQGCPRS